MSNTEEPTSNLVDKTNNLDEWVTEQFTTINDSLTLFKMQINSLQKVVKNVEKDIRKEIKTLKRDKKKDVQKDKRAPSGFAKPTKVTKELCDFMNKPEGSEIARTEVTKALVNYIKENNLIETNDVSKNKIVPDEKLKNLLGIQNEELNVLTYFNIQKYMNKHFYTKKTFNLDIFE
jgi:chromatin remodeling complex protein RSC6